MDYVQWFMHRYGLNLTTAAATIWEQLAHRAATVRPRRDLVLYAFRQDAVPHDFQCPSTSIDVSVLGLDARADYMYSMSEVTGLDFEVQAVLLTQVSTAQALWTACAAIEQHDRVAYAFVCRGATHRSVACCVLLTAFFYLDARIALTTSRTKAAAAARHLTTCNGR